MMDPVDPANIVAAGAPPPAIAPPPGITGLFEEYDPNALLDMSQFRPGQVFANVYDLGDNDTLKQINAVTTANNNLLIGGLFHVGVEVYGAEMCYGFTEEERSGVSCIMPRSHPQHTYRTTVPLGYTSKSMQEVKQLTQRISEEWKGNTYHLLHKNCQNFANAFCQELGVRKIPGWVDRAARAASAIDHTKTAATEGAREVVTLVRSMTSEVETTVLNALPPDEAVQQIASEAVEVAEHVRKGAEQVGENVKQGGMQALTMAQQAGAEFAEEAKVQAGIVQTVAGELGGEVQERMQSIAGAAQPHLQNIGSAVQATAQDLLGEDFSAKAQQVGEKTQEHARAISSTLGAHAQDLLGEDLSAKAQQVGEKTQEHARAFGSGLWSVARSVTADLQQAASSMAEEKPVRGQVKRNIARDKRAADKGGSGWDALGDLLGFPAAAAASAPTPARGACFERSASPMSPESAQAHVSPSFGGMKEEERALLHEDSDTDRVPKAPVFGDLLGLSSEDASGANGIASDQGLTTPAKVASAAGGYPAGRTATPAAAPAAPEPQKAAAAIAGDDDDQE